MPVSTMVKKLVFGVIVFVALVVVFKNLDEAGILLAAMGGLASMTLVGRKK